MESELESVLQPYDYTLPPELIRSIPIEPRHNARLLVYNTVTDTITDTTFFHLDEFLPQGTHIVLNHSKVLPVRLEGKKETGGKIEVFVLMNELKDESCVPCLLTTKLNLGAKINFGNYATARVIEYANGTYYLAFSGKSLRDLLETFGTTPIPHYLHTAIPEQEARLRYQTIFAQDGNRGSVAAPTASLHFTDEVFEKLKKKNVEIVPVTLHVGRGTFAPLRKEQLVEKKLHAEYYEISDQSIRALQTAHSHNEPILAVGTTAMRTLESFAQTKQKEGDTTLFIHAPYAFTYATMMLTNFHLPKTSLMMLVDAYLKYKGAKRSLLDLYDHAIRSGYHFYSFGDAMLIL